MESSIIVEIVRFENYCHMRTVERDFFKALNYGVYTTVTGKEDIEQSIYMCVYDIMVGS